MEKLKTLIDNRCVEILMQEYENEQEYHFFDLINTHIINQNQIKKIKPAILFLALMRVHHPEFDFKKQHAIMEKLRQSIDKSVMDAKAFIVYLDILEFLNHENILTKLSAYEKYDKEIFNQHYVIHLISKLETVKNVEEALKSFYNFGNILFSSVENRNLFIQLMIDYSDTQLLSDYTLVLAELVKICIDQVNISSINEVKSKVKTTPYKKQLKEILLSISTRTNFLKDQKRKFLKANKKKIISYKQFLSFLEKQKENQIIEITSEIEKNLEDETIKQEFYRYVILHNIDVYEELRQSNSKHPLDKISQLEQVLGNNEISIHLLSPTQKEQIVKKHEISKISEILTQINECSLNTFFNNQSYLFSLLTLDSFEPFYQMIEYQKKSILSHSFLEDYLCTILTQHKIYENFIQNMELLLNFHLDILEISVLNPKLLLLDHQNLKQNTVLVEFYQLHFNKTKKQNYQIYCDHKIFDDIDDLIELNLYDWIKENPKYLEIDLKNMIKRVKISKRIYNPVMDSNSHIRESIISGKNFYIKENQLDDYIEKSFDFYPEYKQLLELNNRNEIEENEISLLLDQQFKIDDLHYQIENTLISRMKVLRNLTVFYKHYEHLDQEMLLHAIIYPSTFTQEETFIIQSKIKKIIHSNYQKKRNP